MAAWRPAAALDPRATACRTRLGHDANCNRRRRCLQTSARMSTREKAPVVVASDLLGPTGRRTALVGQGYLVDVRVLGLAGGYSGDDLPGLVVRTTTTPVRSTSTATSRGWTDLRVKHDRDAKFSACAGPPSEVSPSRVSLTPIAAPFFTVPRPSFQRVRVSAHHVRLACTRLSRVTPFHLLYLLVGSKHHRTSMRCASLCVAKAHPRRSIPHPRGARPPQPQPFMHMSRWAEIHSRRESGRLSASVRHRTAHGTPRCGARCQC
ncbi:hypothetical protein C8Q80DRAFT_336959 [Daedaleopsis nitida]|nr:hypothetical protein C8Q80DRAFT_336959 [Daedaleopsis nitida]